MIKKTLVIFLPIFLFVSGIVLGLCLNSVNILTIILAVYIPVIVLTAIACFMIAKANQQRDMADLLKTQQADSYNLFVPHEFIALLNKESITSVKLGDCIEKQMTVFFSDIRSYTKLSESITSIELFNFLNSYFKQINPCIKNNNGFIDKFIGDAIMALFPGSPENALRAAIDMKHQLDIYNKGRIQAGYDPVRAGFGLHYGMLTLGTIGSEIRMNTTVIGDAVNLASRIESLTKIFKIDIILSDAVHKKLINPDDFNLREIDTVRVKGKQNTVVLYEAFDTDPPEIIEKKNQALPIFNGALRDYKAGEFEKAMEEFEQCRKICPEDHIPSIYIKRSNTMLRVPPGPKWTGVSTL
ncbi:Adenylate/guanylate cyclase catalytic domain-containing protein [Desulfonema limicola]|uniref:Adenylate/guanylate cyclase catalytic domain-containing protein n=1 Tax=Desulfonema limicola TaxID=45656 RepID=A0A975BEB7_9BACT|nr:adenylate/guanylate cyclase domain-containing protein [Desulfonema limicola]QTA83589.1 Adenylate/guanylate cyclase catalytic domain-containing protein [Desulfonema limicola]